MLAPASGSPPAPGSPAAGLREPWSLLPEMVLGLVHAKTRRREVVIVDDPLHSLAKGRAAEIHEQPEGLLHQPQIGEKLFAMHRCQPLDRLDLVDKRTLDEQVCAKAVEDHSLVLDGNRPLPFNGKASSCKCCRQ